MLRRYRYVYLFLLYSLTNVLIAYGVDTPMGRVPDSFEVKRKVIFPDEESPDQKSSVTLSLNPDGSLLIQASTLPVPEHPNPVTANGCLSQEQLEQLNVGLLAHPPHASVSPQMVVVALATLPLAITNSPSLPLLNENLQLTCIDNYFHYQIGIQGVAGNGSGTSAAGVQMQVTHNIEENCIEVSYGFPTDTLYGVIHQYPLNLVYMIPLQDIDNESVVKDGVIIDGSDDSSCCFGSSTSVTPCQRSPYLTRSKTRANREPTREHAPLQKESLYNGVVLPKYLLFGQ